MNHLNGNQPCIASNKLFPDPESESISIFKIKKKLKFVHGVILLYNIFLSQ